MSKTKNQMPVVTRQIAIVGLQVEAVKSIDDVCYKGAQGEIIEYPHAGNPDYAVVRFYTPRGKDEESMMLSDLRVLTIQGLNKTVSDFHQRVDGLAIMDAIADVIADRYDIEDLYDLKRKINQLGAESLYDQHVGPAIDRICDELGLD